MEVRVNYIKQYGAMRTGTNYLKRLLEINFNNLQVFGSILGWKHGMYETKNGPDHTVDHKDWLNKQFKNGKVYSVDGYPLTYSYDELLESIDKLKYIINIKKPHAYVVSYKKFRFPKQQLTIERVKKLCSDYNIMYNKWKKFYENTSKLCLIVTHESILYDFRHVLFNIQTSLSLIRKTDRYTDEVQPVKASTDHGLLIDRGKIFNKDYYLNSEYMNELSTDIIKIIDDTIDHDVLKWFYNNGL